MDNITYGELVRRHIEDTLTHKQFFIQSCFKMMDYLYDCNRYDDALELAKRCSVHDHSKFELEEVRLFIQLPSEKDKKPNGVLTAEQRELIRMHWSKNRHHPEFFTDYKEMCEIDILEMVCDWYARSLQFGTSFMNFVNTVPQKRFGFDDEFFETVLKYCNILNT